jgi:hypothetical protein
MNAYVLSISAGWVMVIEIHLDNYFEEIRDNRHQVTLNTLLPHLFSSLSPINDADSPAIAMNHRQGSC